MHEERRIDKWAYIVDSFPILNEETVFKQYDNLVKRQGDIPLEEFIPKMYGFFKAKRGE